MGEGVSEHVRVNIRHTGIVGTPVEHLADAVLAELALAPDPQRPSLALLLVSRVQPATLRVTSASAQVAP